MISKTFVINLARRPDKRAHMESEFAKLASRNTNLNHEFFLAVDGADTQAVGKFNFRPTNWYDPNSGKSITNGEIGCALSHYSTWVKFVDLVDTAVLPTDSHVLILEDDVIFLDDFEKKYRDYIAELDGMPFDMMYLHRKPLNAAAEKKLSSHITNIKKSYWACAYVLSYSGAKKLLQANYLDNLIPVDEFLPIMYNCNVNGFEKDFLSAGKIRCYAVTPSLLKLTGNAFNESETFHSGAFVSEPTTSNSEPATFIDKNKSFVCIYIGPTNGMAYNRFGAYCKLYGIPVTVIDSEATTDSVCKYLSTWTVEKISNTFVMAIIIKSTDTCNVIPLASPTEIVDTYKQIGHNRVISAVIDNYSSKSLLCGWASAFNDLFTDSLNNTASNNTASNNTNNTASNNTNKFNSNNTNKFNSINTNKFNSINTNKFNSNNTNNTASNKSTLLDAKSKIFYLVDSDIGFKHTASRVTISKTNIQPMVIFASSPKSVILLNRAEDYTGNGWNEFYGYKMKLDGKTTNLIDKPKIYLSYRPGTNISALLSKLNYPIDRIQAVVNDKNDIVAKFLATDCDYYFFVNNKCVIENPETLTELLLLGKEVVAPMVRRGNDYWTNFWGDLDQNGFYSRSFDYFDLINNNRRGCWNVPYISDVFLVKRSVLELVPDVFIVENDMDIDMRFCHNLRKAGIFMYVSNISNYGFLMTKEQFNASAKLAVRSVNTISSDSGTQPVTLYNIFDRRTEWEAKYIHPNVLTNLNSITNMLYNEICPDIYTFMLFTDNFCTDLINLAEANNKWSHGRNQHSDNRLGKNYYENVPTVDVQLFQLGLEEVWKEIVFNYIAKVAHVLYSKYITKNINLAFVVRYKAEEQSSLEPHHDSSTYTVNIALNRGNGVDYTDGGCRFLRQNYTLQNQEPGSCCIHPGRLTAYHEGLPVTSGTRYIMVSFIN